MIDSGQLSPESVLEEVPALKTFTEQGRAFEAAVRAEAVAIPDGKIPTLSEYGSTVIFGVPVVHNETLGIYGRLDAVAVESGTLAPLEVKLHRKRTSLDEIELCFYWELLGPWRSPSLTLDDPDRPDDSGILTVKPLPHGYLLLPDLDSGYRMEKVLLTEKRFEDMRRLVDEVRGVRQEPPPQRICDCPVCSRLFREEMEERAHARGDLTLISGIGRKRALVLETAGISNIETLQKADPADMVTALRAARTGVPSQREAEGWTHHATAFTRGEPVVFGDSPFDRTEYIALDLEYDSDPVCRAVYLAGAMAVLPAGMETVSIWADYGEERTLLNELADLLGRYPDLPVVTWNGKSADGVQLREACLDVGLASLWTEFQARHVDLYRNLLASVRFPISGFKLKSLARYLGIKTKGRVVAGLDTVGLWREYCEAPRSKRSAAIRNELTTYNTQDVTTLVSLTEKVGDLAAVSAP